MAGVASLPAHTTGPSAAVGVTSVGSLCGIALFARGNVLGLHADSVAWVTH